MSLDLATELERGLSLGDFVGGSPFGETAEIAAKLHRKGRDQLAVQLERLDGVARAVVAVEFFGADGMHERRPVVLVLFDDRAQIHVQRVASELAGERDPGWPAVELDFHSHGQARTDFVYTWRTCL